MAARAGESVRFVRRRNGEVVRLGSGAASEVLLAVGDVTDDAQCVEHRTLAPLAVKVVRRRAGVGDVLREAAAAAETVLRTARATHGSATRSVCAAVHANSIRGVVRCYGASNVTLPKGTYVHWGRSVPGAFAFATAYMGGGGGGGDGGPDFHVVVMDAVGTGYTLADDFGRWSSRASGIFARSLGSFIGDVLRTLSMFEEVPYRGAWHDLVHGAIKPSHVLITMEDNAPRAVLCGFGSVTLSGQLTVAHAPTYPYTAPEMVQGARASRAADVWGIAMTLLDVVLRRLAAARGEDCDTATAEFLFQQLFVGDGGGPAAAPDYMDCIRNGWLRMDILSTRCILGRSEDDVRACIFTSTEVFSARDARAIAYIIAHTLVPKPSARMHVEDLTEGANEAVCEWLARAPAATAADAMECAHALVGDTLRYSDLAGVYRTVCALPVYEREALRAEHAYWRMLFVRDGDACLE